MKALQQLATAMLVVVSLQAFAQSSSDTRNDNFDNTTNCRIRYYYYPNLEAYYDRQTDLYIYKDHTEWVREKEIPSGYRGYGLFNRSHIAIRDYDDDDPVQFLDEHRKQYPYNSLRKTSRTMASKD